MLLGANEADTPLELTRLPASMLVSGYGGTPSLMEIATKDLHLR
jgi:hypothetical protein